jgi:hypothetical protein
MNRSVPLWILVLAVLAGPAYTIVTDDPPAEASPTPPITAAEIGDDEAVTSNTDWFGTDVAATDSHPASAWRVWILIDEGASNSVVNQVYSDGSVGALNGGTALTAGVEYAFIVGTRSGVTWNLQAETGTTVDKGVVQRVEEGQ